ncbi:hypothetical protein C8Q77DRAFT_1152037 [Trametes polyzona]|nr:hypothetical protein C8Q77DRAFT_1152037 [Trametes polyzona]
MSSPAVTESPPPDPSKSEGAMHRTHLHSLPVEVIERALIFSDPRDVSRYAQTCRFARKLVYEPKDHFLWRELYLGRPFDDPRRAVPVPKCRLAPRVGTTTLGEESPLRWRYELQRRIEAEAIASSGEKADAGALVRAFEAFLAAVDTALPVTDGEGEGDAPHADKTTDAETESEPGRDEEAKTTSAPRSENLRWLDRVLRRTKVLNLPIPPSMPEAEPSSGATTTAGSLSSPSSVPVSSPSPTISSPPAPAPPPPPSSTRVLRSTRIPVQAPSPADALAAEAHQLRCRLRAYVALSHESSFSAESRARMAKVRNASRCFVYDMRRYQPETLWGPYRVVYSDGSAQASSGFGVGGTGWLGATSSAAVSAGEPDVYVDIEGQEVADEEVDGNDEQMEEEAELSAEDAEGEADEHEGSATTSSASTTSATESEDNTPVPAPAPGNTSSEQVHRRVIVVNWEHIEHIINVVGLKLREVPHTCLGYYKKPPFTLDALRAHSAVGALEPAGRLPHDWAGVTGKWRRFVCFMDYRDLYMFNYSHLPPGPHHPSFFEDPFDEALRPVELHLSLITPAEYFADPRRIPRAPPSIGTAHPEDARFPTLYFEGHSRGPHASRASIRGTVSTLADGAVRWQFVTTYDGRMQWSAEGIQIGHVCSAAGIAGIWTGAHHDRDDPAGPFWMIKADDNLPEGVINTLH